MLELEYKVKLSKCYFVIYIYTYLSFIKHVLSFETALCEKCRSKSRYSVRKQENMEQKKLRIWTLFTQCRL